MSWSDVFLFCSAHRIPNPVPTAALTTPDTSVGAMRWNCFGLCSFPCASTASLSRFLADFHSDNLYILFNHTKAPSYQLFETPLPSPAALAGTQHPEDQRSGTNIDCQVSWMDLHILCHELYGQRCRKGFGATVGRDFTVATP